jgi:hypothetical protein
MTAVEWLWEQIDNTIPFQNIQVSQIFNGLLQQAKEMEKQQIINAYSNNGWNDGDERADAEQYYTSTYGSQGITLQNNSESKAITELSDVEIKKMYSKEDMEKCWNAAYIDALAIDEETYKPLFFGDFIEQLKTKKD